MIYMLVGCSNDIALWSCLKSHVLGTFSRQVCQKTSQMSEISFFFMIHMLVSCLKVIALSLHFLAKYVANLAKKLAKWLNLNFCNDFLCWLVVQMSLRIELYLLGPFSCQVCQKTSQMCEMSFFYDSYVGQLFERHCAISPFSRQICRQSCQKNAPND